MAEAASKPWRLIFFGSGLFSVPALKALAQGPDEVVLVVSAPPARQGRGLKVAANPLAALSGELGLELLEVRGLREPETLAAIEAKKPDLLVTAAYGSFLPARLIELCPWPPLNIHPSLLPRHRGPAPVNWSIIKGDRQMGVSIIFLEKEMDAGAVLRSRAYDYQAPASAGFWEERLAEAGAQELMAAIADLKEGRAEAQSQDSSRATVNRLLGKADGLVDFQRPAAELAALINGVDPWPGAHCSFKGRGLKLYRALAWPETQGRPGQVLGLEKERGGLLVAAAEGAVAIGELQPEGKKRLQAEEFWRGYRPQNLGEGS